MTGIADEQCLVTNPREPIESMSQASSPTTRSYRPSSMTSWKTMKVATKISSMRRSALKQCRSCPEASEAMLARFRGKPFAGRVHLFAPFPKHRRHGIMGQPVDLDVGTTLPQFGRDRQVAARMTQPDG
ncbi:hypothetical protein BH24ACT15_BH24ACT15_21120 [soil metagenome]